MDAVRPTWVPTVHNYTAATDCVLLLQRACNTTWDVVVGAVTLLQWPVIKHLIASHSSGLTWAFMDSLLLVAVVTTVVAMHIILIAMITTTVARLPLLVTIPSNGTDLLTGPMPCDCPKPPVCMPGRGGAIVWGPMPGLIIPYCGNTKNRMQS